MTNRTIDRRSALALAGMAAGSAAMGTTSAEAATRALDLEDPRDLLEAMVKVRNDTSGEPAMTWSAGHVWSHIDGRKSEILLRAEVISVTRALKRDWGYVWISKEAVFFEDPETEEVIDTWRNPFLGREVKVFQLRNDTVNYEYRHDDPSPWASQYIENAGDVLFYNDLFFMAPSPMSPDDYPQYVGSDYYQGAGIYNYAVKRTDLDNTEITSAPATSSWTSVRQWMPWMEMGSWAGGLVVTTRGKKLLNGADDLPAKFRSYLEDKDPGFLEVSSEPVIGKNRFFYEHFKEYVDGQGGS